MKKKLIITIMAGTVALFTLQACTDSKGNTNLIPRNSEPIPVRVMPLGKSKTNEVIKASGQLTTDDETVLGFKTSGIVNTILVKEGDAVKKGQVLATLDLREIDGYVSQARHAYDKAQRDFQRARNLFADSVATLEQMQNAETGLAVAKEQLETTLFNKNYSTIHAVANGYVLKKFVNPGQVVDVGDPILLTNGAADAKWILKTAVSDKQWRSVSLQNKAVISIDAFPGSTFHGYVSRKAETSDPETGAFTVELHVNSDGEKFASGMFGSAEIVSARPQNSWQIPYEAVLDANDNEGFVFVTNDGKIAVKQAVTIASFDGNTIHVSEGLENSNFLITSGSAYISDKSPITILK
jgi:RND family efflux transporter MFP subunit